MVDESNIESNDVSVADDLTETEKFEIKCICGFRVFTKIRPPVVKTVKAL